MKITSVLLTGLLSACGASAFAQVNPIDQLRHDNAAIRQDSREIRTENRAIHRDNVDINRDKHDIARDRAAIRTDRQEARQDQRREDIAIAHGNLHAAQRFERAREHEIAEIRAERRDIRRERADIAQDRQDRNHVVAARKDERAERQAAIARRNGDAASIH